MLMLSVGLSLLCSLYFSMVVHQFMDNIVSSPCGLHFNLYNSRTPTCPGSIDNPDILILDELTFDGI